MCTGTWPRERTTGWAYSRQAPDPSTALRRTAPTLQASVSSVLPLHFRCSCTIRTQACQSGIAKAHTSGKSSLLRELDAKLDQFFWGLLSEGVTPSGSSFRTRLSDQPIGDVLRRHGIAPSPSVVTAPPEVLHRRAHSRSGGHRALFFRASQ